MCIYKHTYPNIIGPSHVLGVVAHFFGRQTPSGTIRYLQDSLRASVDPEHTEKQKHGTHDPRDHPLSKDETRDR